MTTLSDIYQKTKQLLEEHADTNSDIDTKLHFSSYIRDSIQFIKIVICLEDEYDIEFDNQDLQLEKYKSIDDFIQMIYQKIVQLSGEGHDSWFALGYRRTGKKPNVIA